MGYKDVRAREIYTTSLWVNTIRIGIYALLVATVFFIIADYLYCKKYNPVAGKYQVAKILVWLGLKDNHGIPHAPGKITIGQYKLWPIQITQWQYAQQKFRKAIPFLAAFAILAIAAGIGIQLAFAPPQQKQKTIRGAAFLKPSQLQKWLNKQAKKDAAKIDKKPVRITKNIHLPTALETQHILVVGTTGTGKTTILANVLQQLRNRQEKAIILDLKGDYLSKFYLQDKDYILNPFDRRDAGFAIIQEIREVADADRLAASIIPRPSKEKGGSAEFFAQASQQLLSAVFLAAVIEKHTTNAIPSWAEILAWKPSQLQNWLQQAASKVADTSVKTKILAAAMDLQEGTTQTQGVMGTVRAYASFLVHLPHRSNFSLRQWVQEAEDSFLFLSLPPAKLDALRGFASLIVNLTITEALSLSDDIKRRLFIFADEISNIQHLPTLPTAVSVGRSKGLSVWLGLQDFGRIQEIYGKAVATTIINNCNTQLFLRVADADTAKVIANTIGTAEIERENATITLGELQHGRGGTTIMQQIQQTQLLLPSQLQELEQGQVILIAKGKKTKDVILQKHWDAKTDGYVPKPTATIADLLQQEKPAKTGTGDEKMEIKPQQEQQQNQQQHWEV